MCAHGAQLSEGITRLFRGIEKPPLHYESMCFSSASSTYSDDECMPVYLLSGSYRYLVPFSDPVIIFLRSRTPCWTHTGNFGEISDRRDWSRCPVQARRCPIRAVGRSRRRSRRVSNLQSLDMLVHFDERPKAVVHVTYIIQKGRCLL